MSSDDQVRVSASSAAKPRGRPRLRASQAIALYHTVSCGTTPTEGRSGCRRHRTTQLYAKKKALDCSGGGCHFEGPIPRRAGELFDDRVAEARRCRQSPPCFGSKGRHRSLNAWLCRHGSFENGGLDPRLRRQLPGPIRPRLPDQSFPPPSRSGALRRESAISFRPRPDPASTR